jgi:putative transposase
MEYRRAYLQGGTFFFTLVTYKHRPIFTSPEAVDQLRQAFRYTLERKPFTIVASVILPDHIHFIWTLPPGDSDFSTRVRLVKSHFTRKWGQQGAVSAVTSRRSKGEQDIWQRRFWEHLIRDEVDLTRHVEYIHYNPVKHGLVRSPMEWQYSSFSKFVGEGLYSPDWGAEGEAWNGDKGME